MILGNNLLIVGRSCYAFYMLNRRGFLKSIFFSGAALGSIGYPIYEASHSDLTERSVRLADLPAVFDGFRIAFLADFHLGLFTSAAFLESVVAQVNALKPDIIILGGDYIYGGKKYIPEVAKIAGQLRSPYGTYATLGNHDNVHGKALTMRAMQENGVYLLNNEGVLLKRGDASIFLAGVDDMQTGHPDLEKALENAQAGQAIILVTHNPDFFERLGNRQVALGLAGHTHGGQICLPFVGPLLVPSRYGKKYLSGLVQGPFCPVFVTRGIGTVYLPMRLLCRPEIALLTLRV